MEALAKGDTASSTLAMARVISSASSPPLPSPFVWEGSGDLRWPLFADGILDRRPLVVVEGVRVTGGAEDLMAAGEGESLELSRTKVPSRFAPSVQSCSTRWCLRMIWSLFVMSAPQRHKKSKLSGCQNFTRKNFPDGVRKFFRDKNALKVRK